MQLLLSSKPKLVINACKTIKSINKSSVRQYSSGGRRANITYFRNRTAFINDNIKKVQRINQISHLMASKDYLPHYAAGKVVSGFGRGSKSLGCPTANLPEEVVEALPSAVETGVYYGWSSLNNVTYKMVMSIGWNPFFKNEKKSMEIHLLHKFENDFYGEELKVIILGYIRPEMNFSSIDELIKAINNDIELANKALDDPTMVKYKEDPFLKS